MHSAPILVVDDDDDVRTMLCIVLSAEGYAAVGAADGVEALARMRRDGPPPLAFVDLMMPRMNGEDLIRLMRQDPSLARVPVVIMSGQPSIRTAAPAHGVRARLLKPLELDDVLAVAQQFAQSGSDRLSPGGDLSPHARG
jgi:two-component system, OmpR family, response regulator CpxR